VDVLIAVVESAHVSVTQTEEGRVLSKLVAVVRNSQKQFLRIGTPGNSDVWSTVVAGQPVKPARDGEGLVMVPLQKSSGQDDW